MKIPERYLDADLYRKSKTKADASYEKPSAYKSAFLVKTYKELGGRLKEEKKPSGLTRWARADWKNLTPYAEGLVKKKDVPKCGQKHPKQSKPSVCRPAKEAKKYSKKQIKKAVEIKAKGKQIDWSKL